MSIIDGAGLVPWEDALFEQDSDLLRRTRWAFASIRAEGGQIILNEAGRPYGVPGDTAIGRVGLPESRTASGLSTVYYQWGRYLAGLTPSAANPQNGPLASEHTQGLAIDCNAPTVYDMTLRARYFAMVGMRQTIASESWHWAIRGPSQVDLTTVSGGGATALIADIPRPHQEEEEMYIRARTTGPSGDARQGYVYRRTEGSWMAVTSLEGDTIVPALATDFHTLIPDYEGADLELLFATDGLWEQLPLEGAPQSSVGPLLGLGARTGRRLYRGSPGALGQWHYPHMLGTSNPGGV